MIVFISEYEFPLEQIDIKGKEGEASTPKIIIQLIQFILKFSTNEVRGPFITPVQQTSQSEQIVETAEDEVESPKWSYSGPTGKSIGVSGQESLIYLVVSK